MWTDLLEPDLLQAAYALDSTLIELIFISGPLLTAAIAAVASPAAALIRSDVDRPARARPAPSRLRAGLDADRADLHQRPAADRGDCRRRLTCRRADPI